MHLLNTEKSVFGRFMRSVLQGWNPATWRVNPHLGIPPPLKSDTDYAHPLTDFIAQKKLVDKISWVHLFHV